MHIFARTVPVRFASVSSHKQQRTHFIVATTARTLNSGMRFFSLVLLLQLHMVSIGIRFMTLWRWKRRSVCEREEGQCRFCWHFSKPGNPNCFFTTSFWHTQTSTHFSFSSLKGFSTNSNLCVRVHWSSWTSFACWIEERKSESEQNHWVHIYKRFLCEAVRGFSQEMSRTTE